jgi:hypothetical protein
MSSRLQVTPTSEPLIIVGAELTIGNKGNWYDLRANHSSIQLRSEALEHEGFSNHLFVW